MRMLKFFSTRSIVFMNEKDSFNKSESFRHEHDSLLSKKNEKECKLFVHQCLNMMPPRISVPIKVRR